MIPAVRRDVRREESDAVGFCGLLCGPHQCTERTGRGFRPLPEYEVVEVAVVDERDRHRAVLRLDLTLEHGLAQGYRYERLEVEGDRLAMNLGALDVGRASHEQDAGAERASAVRAGEPGSERRAEQDLAGRGGALHRHRLGGGGPGHDQLPVRAADEEEVKQTGVRTHRHPERHPPHRRRERAHPAQLRPHPVGGRDRAEGMVVALEEQEQRVAPELDQAAAAGVRLGEQCPEGVTDDVRDLLGTDLALPGEALRHLREPRNVHEHHRPVDLAHERVGHRLLPVENEPGQIGLQRRRHARCHQASVLLLTGSDAPTTSANDGNDSIPRANCSVGALRPSTVATILAPAAARARPTAAPIAPGLTMPTVVT